MEKITSKLTRVLVVTLLCATVVTTASSQEQPKAIDLNALADRSAATYQEMKSDLRLKVVDKTTKKVIKNTGIEIYSDNGIRCRKAPCPTNGKQWRGRTNARGIVIIPADVIQNSMTITAPGYSGGKDLNREAKKLGKWSWLILLGPD